MAVVQGQANLNDVGGIKSAYGGYAGWNDPNAIVADFNATGGAGKGGATNPAPPPTNQPGPVGGGTPALSGGVNPNDANSIKAAYNGYTGWNDPAAIVADFKATGGAGKGGPTASGGSGVGNMFNQPTIDLQGISDSNNRLFGVHDQQRAINDSTDVYKQRMSALNDNPYLSEATLTGAGQKLTDAYNIDIKNKQDALAMATADSQARTAIATQQFNINSQQAQQAFSMANTLLANGALDTASGADIAQLVKATGIPSSIWQSAITTQTSKDTPTQIVMSDDHVNQIATVLNSKTGAVISSHIIGPTQQTNPSQIMVLGNQTYNVTTDPRTGAVTKTLIGPAPATSSGGGGGGGGSNGSLTNAQSTAVYKVADKALQAADQSSGQPGTTTQSDKKLSKTEFTNAILQTASLTGLDPSVVGPYVLERFNALGYQKWQW